MRLEEGRNCWRISRIDKARLLIDGEAYFGRFRQAAIRAERQIRISAWDIDSQFDLVRSSEDDGYPHRLGEFLLSLLKKKKQLHIYMLLWDFSMIYALERDWSPVFNHAKWRKHRRLHLIMDGRHPAGASHHQKIVTIDDNCAFVGGFDLSKWRWDTSAHDPHDRRRVDPSGERYPPFHDVQFMLSGPIVKDLNAHFAHRWKSAAGADLPELAQTSGIGCWPEGDEPDFQDISAGIARTYHDPLNGEMVDETEQLHIDAVRSAARLIYIENQYLSSSRIGNELIKRLKEETGPEIVIVLPRRTGGWLEQVTMDVLRDRLLYLFRLADRHSRLRVYYPELPDSGDQVLSVHAKLFIVDDQTLKAGSSNLSNRSMALDSECDIVIAAGGEEKIRKRIKAIRHRLISEHLGVAQDEYTKTEQDTGSMISAIERLNTGARKLTALQTDIDEKTVRDIAAMKIVDPEKPVAPEQLIDHFIGKSSREARKTNVKKFLTILLGLVAVALILSFTPLKDRIDQEAIAAWFGQTEDLSWMHAVYLTGFILLAVLGLPLTALIGGTGIIFGPLWGSLIAYGGSIASAVLSYFIGEITGKDFVRSFAGKKVNSISRQLSKRGMWTILFVRVVPVAPFAVINLLAGASHIRQRDYILGTMIGMMPGVLVLTTFFGQLIEVIREASTLNILILAGLLILVLAVIGLALKYLYDKNN